MCRGLFFIGTDTGRVALLSVGNALFARILVHLVALGNGVGQQVGHPLEIGVAHQLVAQVEQVGVAQPEFLADAQRAVALEEAPQNHDDLAALPLGGLEGRGGEDVEEGAAVVALELGDGLACVLVSMVVVAATLGAGQPTVVEECYQPLVAFFLVHQVFYWK